MIQENKGPFSLIQQYKNKKEFDISRKFSLLQYHRGTIDFMELMYNHL